MGLPDPDGGDIGLNDLLNQAQPDEDDTNLPDFDEMDRDEFIDYVSKRGSVPLDDEGRMLVKCPCESWPHLKGLFPPMGGTAVCGIYPMPSPSGGMKMVCTGPLDRRKDGELRGSHPASEDCPYNPSRL